jgi:hypothetical protein
MRYEDYVRVRAGALAGSGKFVLGGLANHAGPGGTGAFPSVTTLVRYTGLSERPEPVRFAPPLGISVTERDEAPGRPWLLS